MKYQYKGKGHEPHPSVDTEDSNDSGSDAGSMTGVDVDNAPESDYTDDDRISTSDPKQLTAMEHTGKGPLPHAKEMRNQHEGKGDEPHPSIDSEDSNGFGSDAGSMTGDDVDLYLTTLMMTELHPVIQNS